MPTLFSSLTGGTYLNGKENSKANHEISGESVYKHGKGSKLKKGWGAKTGRGKDERCTVPVSHKRVLYEYLIPIIDNVAGSTVQSCPILNPN